MNRECLDSLVSRVSVRRLGGMVSEEDIGKLLEIAVAAPSAGNMQPWRIVVVKDSERKQRLAEAALGQSFVATAPVVFVICAVPEESASRYGERGSSLYVIQDTAAITLQILLAAHMMGYGACWVGAFVEEMVVDILSIPENMRPVSMIPIGQIQGNTPPKRPRRNHTDIIVSESFERS